MITLYYRPISLIIIIIRCKTGSAGWPPFRAGLSADCREVSSGTGEAISITNVLEENNVLYLFPDVHNMVTVFVIR